MISSIVLLGMMLVIVGFLALVRARTASLEGGVYYAPLDSAEDWAASLDVALGLDMFSEGSEDASWDMVPMAHAWEGASMVDTTPMVHVCPTYTLRTLAYICMCAWIC